jgi:uncharacterized protein YeaO (DUF488 family)
MIRIKRAYDPAGEEDGERILVDRLWPRGVKREALRLSAWMKELAPSTELRRWFGHDPARWEEFRRRYERELKEPAKEALLSELAEKGRRGNVTLVFSTRHAEYSNATFLRDFIGRRGARRAA